MSSREPELRLGGETLAEAMKHPAVLAKLKDVGQRAGRMAERLGDDYPLESDIDGPKIRPKGRAVVNVSLRIVEHGPSGRPPYLKNLLLVAGKSAAKGGS